MPDAGKSLQYGGGGILKKEGVTISLVVLLTAALLFLTISKGSYYDVGTSANDALLNQEDSFNSYTNVTDSVSFDIDNDGTVENCTISYGPTSGLFTVIIRASTDEGIKYQNTFLLDCIDIKFCQENGVTKVLLTDMNYQTETIIEETCDIFVKDNRIVIGNDDKVVAYWGGPEWNWHLMSEKGDG